MKKFNFSLEKVLGFQNQNLDKLKWDLSNLNTELENIKKDINILNRKYQDTNQEFIFKSSTSISIVIMMSYRNYLDSLYYLIKEKEMEKESVCNKIEDKRQEILDKYKEVFGLNKLREKELEKYNYESKREEQLAIDEFVSYKTARDRL